jgi:thioredoxin reductase (NADPH)
MDRSVPILVVGAGPAGLAASIQLGRDLVQHLVVGREPAGGLLPAAWRIDNLPGFPGGVTGTALARRLAEQASALDLPIVEDEVKSLATAGEAFVARLASGGALEARAVILATGTRPRPWSVPGAEDATPSGLLHRDARTLPADLEGASVAIVGSGDAALDSALSVHRRKGRAVVLARGSLGRANERIVERVERRSIEVVTHSPVERIRVSGSRVALLPQGLEADHLVVCIGRTPDDGLYRMLVPGGPPPSSVETLLPGLLAAGDLIAGRHRFIARAQGDGQRAALLATAGTGSSPSR